MPGHVGLARDPKRGARGRHRDRAAPERAGDEDFCGGFAEPVIAGDGGQRIAVGDGLAPCAEIRAHAERLPASPDVEAKAGADLIDNERGTAVVARRARGCGKFRRRQFEIAAHIVAEGGHQDRGEILSRFIDGRAQARHIVVFEVQEMRAILAGDAGNAGRTPWQCAVIAAARDQHLAPPGAGAGDRHAGRGRIAAVLLEHRPIGMRHHRHEILRKIHHHLAGAVEAVAERCLRAGPPPRHRDGGGRAEPAPSCT